MQSRHLSCISVCTMLVLQLTGSTTAERCARCFDVTNSSNTDQEDTCKCSQVNTPVAAGGPLLHSVGALAQPPDVPVPAAHFVLSHSCVSTVSDELLSSMSGHMYATA